MKNFLVFYFKIFGVEITLTDGFAVLFLAAVAFGVYELTKYLGG